MGRNSLYVLMGEPAVWVEHVDQLCMYRWDKFKPLLERNFRSFDGDWYI